MAQFDVHVNNGRAAKLFPYFVALDQVLARGYPG